MSSLEEHFKPFRENIAGVNHFIHTPFGEKKMIYADWTASGRIYGPIEERMIRDIYPLVANTHTETTTSGTAMTKAYWESKNYIKSQVNASESDILLFAGTGMTGAINKFQRILGFKFNQRIRDYMPEEEIIPIDPILRPVVFVSHMEHHSNQTSWEETIADVEIIPMDENGLISLEGLEKLFREYHDRPYKFVSVTACSNVTGIKSDYHEIARRVHDHGGYCFVDFACSGPYVHIDMHPDEDSYLDAIFLSPHKFLGGPGTGGIVIFNKELYHNTVPDNPGGGTVDFTSPWSHSFIDDIETREDGGTPGFLQAIKTAFAFQLKAKMDPAKIEARENELNQYIFERFDQIPNLVVLASKHRHRMSIFSFHMPDAHYNLFVKLLNDRYGIQTRGGCACAGTYGHLLFNLNQDESEQIFCAIQSGNLRVKPGAIRMSLHPTTTDEEAKFIMDAIQAVAENIDQWGEEYDYDPAHNEFRHKNDKPIDSVLRLDQPQKMAN